MSGVTVAVGWLDGEAKQQCFFLLIRSVCVYFKMNLDIAMGDFWTLRELLENENYEKYIFGFHSRPNR